MIIAYTSGKVVINLIESANLVKAIILGMDSDSDDFDLIIGSDEAGKGEWLGPLIVSAVALTSEQSKILRSQGVIDSKELALVRIGELAYDIEENAEFIKTVVISPIKFNKRFTELHEEGKNLNDLLAWAHAKAISETYNHLNLATNDLRVKIVVDEFAKEKLENCLEDLVDLETIELIQRPHAEDEISVAAASIMARDAREDWIDKASFRLKIELGSLNRKDAAQRSDRHLFSKLEYL